ncbi:MAG: hypothetical protein HXL63_07925 [Thermobifida sp.]|jgi:predicted  nucleic acid-binding Zn-ribbon protein|nr:hypothetical protein [Thermobifida sp.]DAE91128.1 MAG TPA: Protein of unknown function (DUF2746) [Caudoviricetes sp.]
MAVLTSPDLVAAAVALLAACMARLTTRLKRQQKEADDRLSRMNAHLVRAANAAESAADGVHNNHEANLRDDLDEKFGTVLDRLDVLAENLEGIRETVRDQGVRLHSLEGQIEGVRNDARADRSHLYNEVDSLHDRIDRVKSKEAS